jgi:hypothetical protein
MEPERVERALRYSGDYDYDLYELRETMRGE